jgi:hypothetical protein
MIFFVVGFALLLHVLFWGAGLATLATPSRWRRFWPAFVPLAAFALQSLIVWVGCYLNLRGTNQYAWPAEIVPLALLGFAVRARGWRAWLADWGRFGFAWMITAIVLGLLLLPLAIASRGLTSLSLGSCDAADYAAGARVFMEFAHSDRSGFLGLTEVAGVMSADNFFDFWLRLNHFTPSALMALNGSILHCQPHELTNVVTAVVLATTIPLVFWIARSLFGYTAIACLVIAALYGIGPVPWYSYAQVSPAPLLAAQAIAVANWAGITLWNGRLIGSRVRSFSPLLVIAFSVLLGAYNFILLVALAPAGAYVAAEAIRKRAGKRVLSWCVAILAPLLIAGVVFWTRVAGLVERFLLFRTYDFGWRIPPLGPEGWFGLVRGATLEPWPFIVRWPLAVICIAALSWSVVESWRRRRRVALLLCTIVPIFAGYAFLELRAAVRHTNASYDAFKLFAVFFPLLLPAFCWWITLRWSTQLLRWLAVAALSSLVVLGNLVACAMFVWALAQPPLIVDGELRYLRRLESDTSIHSVNLLIPDMWSRLWANAFLLRKPQYFLTHTYEGRLNTPLRGEWDLTTSTLELASPGTRDVTSHFRLVDTRAPQFLRLLTGAGWYDEEHDESKATWRWTQPGAEIVIENPRTAGMSATVHLDCHSVSPRDVAFARVGADAAAESIRIGVNRRSYTTKISIPPGTSRWTLQSRQPADEVPGDSRALSLRVFQIRLVPDRDRTD